MTDPDNPMHLTIQYRDWADLFRSLLKQSDEAGFRSFMEAAQDAQHTQDASLANSRMKMCTAQILWFLQDDSSDVQKRWTREWVHAFDSQQNMVSKTHQFQREDRLCMAKLDVLWEGSKAWLSSGSNEAEKERFKAVRKMLHNPRKRTSLGSVLHCAIDAAQPETVAFLLSHGADASRTACALNAAGQPVGKPMDALEFQAFVSDNPDTPWKSVYLTKMRDKPRPSGRGRKARAPQVPLAV